MREIKFRAWYKIYNRMIYNIQNEFEEKITLGMNCFGDYLNEDEFRVMQYTGLRDKMARKSMREIQTSMAIL